MINRNQFEHDVCPVCGASISGVEARLLDNTCPCWFCRATHLQRRVRQVYEGKQQRASDEALCRKEHALAHRNRLAAELQITTPQSFPTFALPAQEKPLVPLAENRKALFRQYLDRIVQEAFAGTRSPEAPPFSQAEDTANCRDEIVPILRAGCAVCRGRCCGQGGDHAFLTVALFLRFRAQHPQATPEDVYREYDSRLAERTYEDSCVYHQEQGCGLPRDLRPDICNSFECVELDELRREAPASGEAIFLVSLDGSRTVRWSVCGGSPAAQT